MIGGVQERRSPFGGTEGVISDVADVGVSPEVPEATIFGPFSGIIAMSERSPFGALFMPACAIGRSEKTWGAGPVDTIYPCRISPIPAPD